MTRPAPLRPLSELKNIQSISQLVPGKFIYLVLNGDGDTLVVKNENHPGDAPTVASAFATMAKVSPGGEAKLVDARERQELVTYVNYAIADLLLGSLPVPQFLTDIDEALSSSRDTKWMKMRQIGNLTTLVDAMNQLQSGAANRKQGVREFAALLNGNGGLEALGRMIAIDAYNNNLDRFSPVGIMRRDVMQLTEEIAVQDGPSRTKRRVMVNSGNVFMTFQRGRNLLVGLDNYDPSNGYALNETIAQGESRYLDLWAGWILQDNARAKRWRKTYSELIALDLDEALGARNRRFSFLKQTRLDSNAPHRLRAGFKQGTDIVTTELTRLCQGGGGSAGVRDRYRILVKGEGSPLGR
ncbi:MAG: hypothetical protein MUF21_10715 [Gemmatimonadaceae bacterium]|nr:hypothetical protein [Gemmatimonadaceae bacterium]